MNFCIRTTSLKNTLRCNVVRFSTTVTEVIEQNEQVLIDDTDNVQAKEAEIMKKRNISRLSKAHFNIMNGRPPFETPKSIAHLTVKYNRKIYGKYGSASGINPTICWPSKKEIEEKMEYEAVAYPFTIKQMMETAAQKRQEEALKIEKRDNDVALKFAKLEQWKKELIDKIAKKEADATAAKEKKERLVEEVRRHFGFKLDPRDDRFKEMLAKREKEQKKLDKMARREAKEKMMIAKLQDQSEKIKEETKS